MLATNRHRALALLNRGLLQAELGKPVAIEVAMPARPLLGQLIDSGLLRRVLALLERDGHHARIAIRPRRAAGPPTITELFEEDHRRLDELAAQMRSVAHEDPVRAIVLANLLVCGLRRHVRIEEEVVFPMHEAWTRYAATTKMMRSEHAAILTYVARIEREADSLRVTAHRDLAVRHLLEAEAGLAAVLADHNQKEEGALFPLLDHTISGGDRERILRTIVLY